MTGFANAPDGAVGGVTCTDCGTRNHVEQVHCAECRGRLRTSWHAGDW